MAILTSTTTGTTDDDIILGGAGNDNILGNDGNDIITGAAGNNTIDGGLGKDTINYGTRTDTGANYTEGPNGVTVDLGAGTATNADGGTDTITNVENVIGTTHDDTIYGNAQDNVMQGNGGQDTIMTFEGDDTVVVKSITGSTMDGGDHTLGKGDTLDYSAVTGDLVINLNSNIGQSAQAADAGGLVDNLSGFENVILGKGNDTVTLGDGVRNIITHTTNIDANGHATGTGGNGGNDTLNGFQFGNNYNADGTNNLSATFDVVDLSKVIVPVEGTRSNYIRVTESGSDLVITISASGGLTGAGAGDATATDVTRVTLTGASYASLMAAYGMTGINSTETALTALLAKGNVWLGSNAGVPEITSPQEQMVVEEGQSVTFKGVNTLSVQDWLTNMTPDTTGIVTVTLDLRNPADPTNQSGVGKLKLGGVIATVMTDADLNNGNLTGDNSTKIVLKGTVAQVNAALADLKYTSAADNQAADQLLRVTIVDADGKQDVEDIELIVQAKVQNAAALTVSQTSQLLANGATEANLNLKVAIPTLDADGSESVKVIVAGVPAGATLDSTTAAHGATIAKDATSGNWVITGTTAQVQAATAGLKLSALASTDYPISLTATVTTTDADAEGIFASASKSVSFVIDAYAADVTATAGKQAVGSAKSENIIGLDTQGDQISSGSGADKLKAYTTTDQSKNDLVNYSVAPSGETITQGVDVNLQTGKGRGGHAEGDSYDGFEGAIGTQFDDRFIGKVGQRNTFTGGLGNDIFVAKTSTANSAEADILSGGNGSDTVSLGRVGKSGDAITVDLNKASQDFNADGKTDASLSSIENVITGAGNDTITLVNSTATVLQGSTTTSGSTNANVVYVNRTDNGADTVINFQGAGATVYDKIDLSGVLKTGLSGDLSTFVKLNASGADTVLSIDKNKDGVADTTVTLKGVAAGTWADANAMATAGVLVHNLAASVGTATTAQTTDYIEGGRARMYFDVSTGMPGATPTTGDVLTFKVGGSVLTYTVKATDTSYAILATSVGAAINAATNLDGQAFVNGSTVEYRLNALSEAVAGDLSVNLSRSGLTTTTIAVSNANSMMFPAANAGAATYDYTIAKIQIGTATTLGAGGQGWYYGVAYAASNATKDQALSALAANMRAKGVDATWDSATGEFKVNSTAVSSNLSFASSNGSVYANITYNGAPANTWTQALDAAGIAAEGTTAKTGAPAAITGTGTYQSNQEMIPYTTTYATSTNQTVVTPISVGGLSVANDQHTLAANAVKGSSNYWLIDYNKQVNDTTKLTEISAKVGSNSYTQTVTSGDLTAAVKALVAKINTAENSYEATQVGNTLQLGLATQQTQTVMAFQNSQVAMHVHGVGGSELPVIMKITVQVGGGAATSYYAAARGFVNQAATAENGFIRLVEVLKAAGISASWDATNQTFTVQKGVAVNSLQIGYVYNGELRSSEGAVFTATDKSAVETVLSNVGNSQTITSYPAHSVPTSNFAFVQGSALTGAGTTTYKFGNPTWTSGTSENFMVAKVTVNGTTYYAAAYSATTPTFAAAMAALSAKLTANSISNTWAAATGTLTINQSNVSGLAYAVVNNSNQLIALSDTGTLGTFNVTTEKTAVNAELLLAKPGTTVNFASAPSVDLNGNYADLTAVLRTNTTDYANYSAGLPGAAVSGGIKLAAGAIVQNDVDDATTATAEVMTVTLSGSVVTGSVYNITLNGKTYSVTAAAGDTLTTLGTKLSAAVNADKTAVSEVWQVAINNATVLHAGDVLTVKVNGVDYSYTVKATDTLQTARDGLLNAINGITSKQVYTVAVDAAALPAAGSKVSVTVDGQVVEYTVKATDTTADLVIAGLRKAVNEVALAKNVTTALDAAGHLVITHHDAVNGTFAATGTGVTGTEKAGVFGTAPAAGVHAEIGSTEGVIKLVSSSSALTVVMTYKDTSVTTPVDVDVSAKDVNKVVAFNADSSSLVTATDAAGVVTLTSKAAGFDLQVTASVKPADVSVLEGAQHYYAYNGVQETFVWRDDAIAGNDTVAGFKIGEDKLNLVQVLKGASAALSNYITVTDAGAAGNVTLAIDADGDAATTGDRFNIVLGGAGTGSVTLSSLIDQGSLLAPSALS